MKVRSRNPAHFLPPSSITLPYPAIPLSKQAIFFRNLFSRSELFQTFSNCVTATALTFPLLTEDFERLTGPPTNGFNNHTYTLLFLLLLKNKSSNIMKQTKLNLFLLAFVIMLTALSSRNTHFRIQTNESNKLIIIGLIL